MKQKEKSLKIVIGLLIMMIVLLIGFMFFFIEELREEKEEMKNFDYTHDLEYRDDRDVSGQPSRDPKQENYISRNEAFKIALEDINLSQSDVYDMEIELDYKYGQVVYEVTFHDRQFEYEYYIQAETGEIIKSFREID